MIGDLHQEWTQARHRRPDGDGTLTRPPVRVLCVDDSPDEVALELAVLRGGGLDLRHEVVRTPDELESALTRGGWDVVLCGHRLARFEGLQALELVHAIDGDLPVILISRAAGEELAVEAMRAGAHDYLLKDNLGRLAAAVERELGEVQERREGRLSFEGLQLLADAGAALTDSRSIEAAIRRVAELVLGRFGDLCVVDLDDREGRVHRAARVHIDPNKTLLLEELVERNPPRVPEPGGVDQAVAIDLGGNDRHPAWPFVKIARGLGASHAAMVLLRSPSRIEGQLGVAGREPYAPLLLRVLEELGRRVGAAIEAARLLDEAQKSIRVRDEFLLVTSHELKTPLTAMQLQLQGIEQLVKKSPREVEPERLRNRVARTIQSMERLSILVEGLLDVSCIATGRMVLHLETFDLFPVLVAVADRVKEQLERSGSTLRLPKPKKVVGKWDRLRIEQVLTNLLSNAIKYGKGKAIDLELAQRDGSGVITLIDRGIGIPAEDLERVFGRFERAVSSRHYGGLGLGLYVTREIVSAHGGTVIAKATPGGGATFIVELPRVPAWDTPAPL